ncbi:hypothetical protein GCM10010038_12470 [Glutamicibacter protophormiae]|nr:hypothetical protein GCM10010038_12470 [Glutamicibacter protophormiae]
MPFLPGPMLACIGGQRAIRVGQIVLVEVPEQPQREPVREPRVERRAVREQVELLFVSVQPHSIQLRSQVGGGGLELRQRLSGVPGGIAEAGRPMSRQIAPQQLLQWFCGLEVRGRQLVDEHEVLSGQSGALRDRPQAQQPVHDQAHQQVHPALGCGRDSVLVQQREQGRAACAAVLFQVAEDQFAGGVDVSCADLHFTQSRRHGRERAPSGRADQPAHVAGGADMQRPAHGPGTHQRAGGEQGVDVRPAGFPPGALGQRIAPGGQVLGLEGQHAFRGRGDGPCRFQQQLVRHAQLQDSAPLHGPGPSSARGHGRRPHLVAAAGGQGLAGVARRHRIIPWLRSVVLRA